MAKKESTWGNMAMTLGVICITVSIVLGGVYEITAGPKQRAEMAKKTFAIRKVLPEYDNQPYEERFKIADVNGTDSLECYIARQESTDVGVAIQTWTMKGFGGMVRLMVGFDADGKIFNVSVLEQKETPGLGSRMTDPSFIRQFIGMDPGEQPLRVRKDGGQVDALTAATISSRAFCDAVQRAYNSYFNPTEVQGVSGATALQNE